LTDLWRFRLYRTALSMYGCFDRVTGLCDRSMAFLTKGESSFDLLKHRPRFLEQSVGQRFRKNHAPSSVVGCAPHGFAPPTRICASNFAPHGFAPPTRICASLGVCICASRICASNADLRLEARGGGVRRLTKRWTVYGLFNMYRNCSLILIHLLIREATIRPTNEISTKNR